MDLLLEAVEFFSKDPELCRVSCSLIMGVRGGPNEVTKPESKWHPPM